MELTFHLGQDSKGAKRKFTGGACETCRQKKKKCHHDQKSRHSDGASLSRERPREFIQYSPKASHSPQSAPKASTSSTAEAAETRSNKERRHIPPQISRRQNRSSAHRFIGDLNPIVFFVGNENARLLRGREDQGDCGIWLDKDNELLEHDEDASHENAPPDTRAYHSSRQRPEAGRKFILPPQRSQEVLVDIYFRRINPILPLVDEQEFRTQFQEHSISPRLLQAICLVASKDPDAIPILRLEGRTGTLSSREFSNSLYDDLALAVALKAERTRLTLIQILALLSLHNPGPKTFEESAMYLAQAIQHAFTIGLHLTKGMVTEESRPFIALFWSLWSLDRWNGAIHGRPLVIHDRDLGQQLTDVIDLFDAPFRVWLSLASTMGEVTVVYRPMLDAPLDENKPEILRFEEIRDNCHGKDIPMDQMLSLELAYHGIALLASRPWGLRAQPKSRTLYLQQDLAVHRIATLMQMCDVRQFLPLPMIAYCLSLAFALSYKQLKRCKLPSTQHAAKQNMKAFYRSLESLSPTWWLAKIMTRLSKRALDGIYPGTERQEQQPGSGSSMKRRFVDSHFSAGDGHPYMPSPYSDAQTVDITSRNQEQHNPMTGEFIAKNQLPYNSGNTGEGTLNDITEDPMFEDIDNFLGNFLNINIPNAPSHPLFIDPTMTWDLGTLDPDVY